MAQTLSNMANPILPIVLSSDLSSFIGPDDNVQEAWSRFYASSLVEIKRAYHGPVDWCTQPYRHVAFQWISQAWDTISTAWCRRIRELLGSVNQEEVRSKVHSVLKIMNEKPTFRQWMLLSLQKVRDDNE